MGRAVTGPLDLLERKADLIPRWFRSTWDVLRHGDRFDRVETFCFFVGYPRSAHSLVGQLLNAHPDAVISHELHTLRYLRPGFTREQIYSLILRRDRWFATERGREWTGYDYTIPSQWQGRWRDLKVIGDKKGGGTTRWLWESPKLLDELVDRVEDPVRAIHVVRNPYDNIASIARRAEGPDDLSQAVDNYFRFVETVERVRDRLGDRVIDVHLPELLAEPHDRLAEIVEALGLEASDDYLDACAEVMFDEPRATRDEVDWSDDLLDEVRDRLDRTGFLAGYER